MNLTPLPTVLKEVMGEALSPIIRCTSCETPLKVTQHSAVRLMLTESFRCTHCKREQPFPLSWVF